MNIFIGIIIFIGAVYIIIKLLCMFFGAIIRCDHSSTMGGCLTVTDESGNKKVSGKNVCCDCGVVIIDYDKYGENASVDWSVFK